MDKRLKRNFSKRPISRRSELRQIAVIPATPGSILEQNVRHGRRCRFYIKGWRRFDCLICAQGLSANLGGAGPAQNFTPTLTPYRRGSAGMKVGMPNAPPVLPASNK